MTTTTETLTVEQLIRAPAARVWEAISSPDWLGRWWGAGDIRAEVGHRFTVDMGKWGLQPCEVLEVVPGERLVYRFTDSWVLAWTLEPRDGATLLRLEHRGFDLDDPQQAFAFRQMGEGWRSAVLPRLAALVEAAEPAPGR